MKAIILTICAIFLSTGVFAADITGQGAVRDVTVFPYGAIIQRVMTVNIPQGVSRISMEGLPVDADQQSLRVDGTGGFSIGAVDIATQVSRDAVNAKEREITAKIEAVDAQITIVRSEIAALQKSSEFITSLWQNKGAQISTGTGNTIVDQSAKQNFTLESWPQVYKSYAESSKQTIEKQHRVAELQKDKSKLMAELAVAKGGGKSTLTAVINVQAAKAVSGTIKVSYMVKSARWAPVYDVRLDTKTSKMQLVMYGTVHQTTGNDWKDVSLTLSTARPAVGTQMPQLSTHWIDYEQQQVRQSRGAAMDAVFSLASAPKAMMVEEAVFESNADAGFTQAIVEANEYNAEFQVPGKVTVISGGGNDSRFRLSTADIAVELLAQSTPKLDQNAYLSGKVKYDGQAPLLAGKATLFRDGFYIGAANIPFVRPGSEYVLSFGVDDKIQITRQVMGDEKSVVGVISRDNRITRNYRTTVHNLHNQPITIEIFDQIPVSRDTSLVVKTDPATTGGFTQDYKDIKGLLMWQSQFKPNEKRDINLIYTVDASKDRRVWGL